MTDSQQKVLNWLEHQRKGSTSWFRPSEIKPVGYQGGPSAIGKVLRALVVDGGVQVDSIDRGNGTKCLVYRAVSTNWKAILDLPIDPAAAKRYLGPAPRKERT